MLQKSSEPVNFYFQLYKDQHGHIKHNKATPAPVTVVYLKRDKNCDPIIHLFHEKLKELVKYFHQV